MKKITLLIVALLTTAMIAGCGNNSANQTTIKASMQVEDQKKQSLQGTAISKSFLDDGAFGRIKVKSDGKAYLSFVVYERYNGVISQQHFGIKEIGAGNSEFDFGLMTNNVYQQFDTYNISFSLKTLTKQDNVSSDFSPLKLLITYSDTDIAANLGENLRGQYGDIASKNTLKINEPLILTKQIVRTDNNYDVGFESLNTLQDLFNNNDTTTPYALLVGVILTDTEPAQKKEEITIAKSSNDAVTYDAQ